MVMDYTSLGLDNPSKPSHKKNGIIKMLYDHIEEIKQISYLLAKKHDLLKLKDIIDDLAEWHDIGKLNPKWSIDNNKNPPHSALSAYIYLNHSRNVDPILFYLILKHHSHLNPHNASYDVAKCREILSYIIRATRGTKLEISKKDFNEILKQIYLILKRLQEKLNKLNTFDSNIIYADLFGIFKTADVISAMFEKSNTIFQEIASFDQSRIESNIKEYVSSKGLKFDQNKWKVFCKMANTKGDVLFTAPTGWGKTFASLTIALNRKPSHIIYVLPTITSIRKMRDTLSKVFSCKVEENYYFADVEKIREGDESAVDFNLFVSKWFISPITITTLDQIVLSFLHVGKYFLKRFHFRNSVFIFDEFHAYPINGLYILINFIKKFNENFGYNIKSIFMSATSHPDLERLIDEHMDLTEFDFTNEYEKKRRYLYNVESSDITDEESLRAVVKKAEECNVLILCNTVENAIRTYLLLKNEYNLKRILLLHSRFTYRDRRDKENKLEELSKLSRGFVLVSTQVAEVSLDVSFDYLFTEIAPIPSLIQRFGRVNRYSDYTEDINVSIFYPTDIDKSRRYPYKKGEIKATFNELMNLEDRIKNELVLIKRYRESPLGLDRNELKEIKRYFEKWENDTKYFFSIDLTDDKLNKLLKFRDTNTALIIPRCFRTKIEYILHSDEMYKLQKIKEYLTPVPIWWVIDSLNQGLIGEVGNILVLLNPRFQYSHEIGYFDTEKLSEFFDQIDICQEDVSIL